MSTEYVLDENQCFNILWEIKNFSYCSEELSSPEFTLRGDLFRLNILPKHVECRLVCLAEEPYKFPDHEYYKVEYLLSFLPCDGSSPLTAIGKCLLVSKEILFKSRRSAFLSEDTLTIRLQFPGVFEKGILSVRSEIGIKRKCFIWKVSNFTKYQCNNKEWKISAENSSRHGIIELSLESEDRINSDEFIYIKVSQTNVEQCYCVLKVSILNIKGKAINKVRDEFLFKKEDNLQKWNFPPICKKNKLLAYKDLLLRDDVLSLKCDFDITLGTITDQTAVYSYFQDVAPLPKEFEDPPIFAKKDIWADHEENLKSDLKRIFDSASICDVRLQVGSEAIYAHKTILAARSPILKSEFTKNMKKNIDNIVTIENLDLDTLRRLLLYMYTDTVDDTQWKQIIKLYIAADNYEVLGLKKKCSSILKSNLSVASVCESLTLADMILNADLRAAILDFISTNHSEVFNSKEWRDFEKIDSSLAIQVLREICSKKLD